MVPGTADGVAADRPGGGFKTALVVPSLPKTRSDRRGTNAEDGRPRGPQGFKRDWKREQVP